MHATQLNFNWKVIHMLTCYLIKWVTEVRRFSSWWNKLTQQIQDFISWKPLRDYWVIFFSIIYKQFSVVTDKIKYIKIQKFNSSCN